jgi:hypothetical protein
VTKRKPPHREVGPHPKTGNLVKEMTAPQLHTALVTDALAGYPTDLAWFVAALDRIADLEPHCDIEEAYRRVRTEVAALGGFMPSAPGQ